jgi:uncharacterized protein YciW
MMGDADDLLATTAVRLSGVSPDDPSFQAVRLRAEVLRMTDRAEAAVLNPRDPGAWSHDMRAALATRIARIHGKSDLAAVFGAKIVGHEMEPVSDPSYPGSGAYLATVLRFMDRVAARPGEVTEDEIAALKSVGVEDADIVRLCELNAFLAYQIGLIHGLSLMAAADD